MKLFLKLLKQSSLLILVLFCRRADAQQEETKKEIFAKQLSIKVALVVPVYYNFNMLSPDIYGNEQISNIKPDFKLSYALGLQYKSKHNILFDLQFQYYDFNCKGPIIYYNNGLKFGNQSYPYYTTFKYIQYRNSVGIGGLIKIKKHSLGIIGGLTLFMGNKYLDQSYGYGASFKPDGTQYLGPGGPGLIGGMSKLAPYIDVCFNYNVLKWLAFTAAANYTLLYYSGGREIVDQYTYMRQSLLSVNVGVKFNVINKEAK